MDDFEIELKMGFLEEAAQSLADVEQCFLSLESDPENADNLNKIFRLAHNLKGSSKAVGFDVMGAFTHEFETFILKIKNGQLPATAQVVSLLLNCNDFLSKMVEGLKVDLAASFDIAPLIAEMNALKDGGSAPQGEEVDASAESEAVPAPAETVAPVEIEPNLELIAELEAMMGPPAKTSASSPKAEAPPAPKAAAAPAASAGKTAPPEETIRISVSKLENLMNYVGEMVILQSVMREQAHLSSSMLLKKTVHQLGKVGKEIQDLSMSLRMIPVKPTFQKMQRIVRDTAQAVNKEVNLVLQGEDTEIDKTVLEKISDPLVHLIRNSVDHGIENKELRATTGKALKGTVTLSAFHHAGKLVIEIKDDGGGLNPTKLINKAIEKGLIKPGTTMSDKDAYLLIFAPGFSTKEQVTDVSGRGVGMDVVKTNVTDLSGEITIESAIGHGTTFRILLPLTLAIIDGMTLLYGNEKYIVPLNHVHETLQPQANQIQKTTMGDVLLLREDNIPIVRLGDFFGKASRLKNSEMIALVVRTGPKPFAILVDDIIGQSQVVVKQLGQEIQGYKGISGSTILGDGKPALILEPHDLIKRKIAHVPSPATASQVGGKAA